MKLEFSRQILEKYPNAKSIKKLSSGIRVVPYGQIDTTKQMVAFHNFAKAPENSPHFMEPEGSIPNS